MEKLWSEYTKDKTERFYETKKETPFETTMFIIKSVVELLAKEQHEQIPFTKTYSSKGMTEFQELVYKIEETEKLLFPDGESYFSAIIFDEYNIKDGLQGLYVILEHFVKWKDSEKNN